MRTLRQTAQRRNAPNRTQVRWTTPHTVAEARILKPGVCIESRRVFWPARGCPRSVRRSVRPAPLLLGYEAGLDIHAPTPEHQPHLSWRPDDDSVTPDSLVAAPLHLFSPQCDSAPQEEAQPLAIWEAEAEVAEWDRVEEVDAPPPKMPVEAKVRRGSVPRGHARGARGGGCAPQCAQG